MGTSLSSADLAQMTMMSSLTMQPISLNPFIQDHHPNLSKATLMFKSIILEAPTPPTSL